MAGTKVTKRKLLEYARDWIYDPNSFWKLASRNRELRELTLPGSGQKHPWYGYEAHHLAAVIGDICLLVGIPSQSYEIFEQKMTPKKALILRTLEKLISVTND